MDDILNIFMFLDVKNIIICSYVNKLFNRVTKNQLLWMRMNDVCFPRVKVLNGSPHETFKLRYDIEKLHYNTGRSIDAQFNSNIICLKPSRTFPLSLLHFPNLTMMDAGETNMQIFDGLDQLINLEKLYLNNCNLSEIPDQIFNLYNLNSLELSHNNLKSIPTKIGNLKNLKYLYLYCNKLWSIPTEICKLTKLTTLALQFNNIQEFPQEIHKMSNLTELCIINNLLINRV